MPSLTNLQRLGAEEAPPPEEKKEEGKKADEKVEDQSQQGPDPEVESEARRFGWVPKDEFKGKPEEWSDAETFVKRGKEINPILRKNNERLMTELKKAEAKIADLGLTVKEFGEMYEKMSKNAYDRAIKDLKKQERAARKEGDDDVADDLETQREKLEKEATEIKAPGSGKTDSGAEAAKAEGARIYNEWVEETPWFDKEKNPDLFYAADGIARDFAQTPEGQKLLGKREFLDEVAKKTKKLLPDRFKNPRREQGSGVEGSSQSRSDSQNKGGKKSYADLPSEAKAICDRQVKNIPGFTKDKYVQYYFEQEGA